MMMKAAVDAVNKQRKLEGPDAEEYAHTFEKHAVMLAAAPSLQAEIRSFSFRSFQFLLLSQIFGLFQTVPISGK